MPSPAYALRTRCTTVGDPILDEADDHLFGLAVAAGAEVIVNKKVRHLRSEEL